MMKLRDHIACIVDAPNGASERRALEKLHTLTSEHRREKRCAIIIRGGPGIRQYLGQHAWRIFEAPGNLEKCIRWAEIQGCAECHIITPTKIGTAHEKKSPEPALNPEAKEKLWVDVVIATIGRRSLEQALLAALHQTYPRVRVVVIGDGPCPEARAVYDQIAGQNARAIYRETPERLHRYGNAVKEWWLNGDEVGPWVRFLDDDDWIPPTAVADMVRVVGEETTLVMCAMILLLPPEFKASTEDGYWQIRHPRPGVNHGCSGMTMLKSEHCKGVAFSADKRGDHYLSGHVARKGDTQIVDKPLYWYNAHQGGKVNTLKMGDPYKEKWIYKLPRTFRKRLFSRVPRGNFLDAAGKIFRAPYDQAMMRPMARLARKKAWFKEPYYVWDKAVQKSKPHKREETWASADYLCERGFVTEGLPYAPVPPDGTEDVVRFLVPAYGDAELIGRCIESIQRQRGEWECVITVDGNDTATAQAARDAIAGDGRFHVVVQPTRRYALGNILAVLRRTPENRIVCLVDSDDYLLGDGLVAAMRERYAEPDVEMVCGCNRTMRLSDMAILRCREEDIARKLYYCGDSEERKPLLERRAAVLRGLERLGG